MKYMNNKPEIWKINHSYENDIINCINTQNNTSLLDLSKDFYSLIEKFVYDTAIFHFKRLNIKNIDNYFIEFWSKTKFDTHLLHLDCDEYNKKTNMQYNYPLLSCVTYLNDNSSPTIITNIDLEKYKYKEFENQTELFLSIPKINKQITFDGKYFHGSTLLDDNITPENRYIIAINLWDIKPNNVNYYINNNNAQGLFDKNEQIIFIDSTINNTQIINVCNNVINYNLFEDILYNNNKTACYQFKNLIHIDLDISSYFFVLDTTIEKKKQDLKLKNKYGNIIDDINEIMNEKISLKYNRFLQRFSYNKIYTVDMCRYIISECEKYAVNNGGWTTKRHDNYPTTDLPVDKIQSIFGLILESMTTIIKKLKKSYNLNENIDININDLFVVKYEAASQNYLELHHDGSFLSFNILLSDNNDFEGGGTYFDDGLTAYLEQGDILIHSSKIKHSGLPITKGTRYLLVGFVNINIKIEDN